MDDATRILDLDDARLTENTRASYPLDFIPNSGASGKASHPANVVMLTADAFGVLPPIARLTADQAMYHFLSGYTAKVAGTEKGLGNEPEATFSTCFGAPFMPRPSIRLRRSAWTTHPRSRRDVLVGQHGLDWRCFRGRRADVDQVHPRSP